jgi:hypothetical protein
MDIRGIAMPPIGTGAACICSSILIASFFSTIHHHHHHRDDFPFMK